MRPFHLLRGIVAVTMVLLLSQCHIAQNTVAMTDVDMRNWDNSATIVYTNSDTTQPRTLSLALHVNRLFEEQELEMDICIMSPDSLRHRERVVIPVNVEWATPTSTTADVELAYRRGVRLQHQGEYIVELTPTRSIVGVEAVGINFQSNK